MGHICIKLSNNNNNLFLQKAKIEREKHNFFKTKTSLVAISTIEFLEKNKPSVIVK